MSRFSVINASSYGRLVDREYAARLRRSRGRLSASPGSRYRAHCLWLSAQGAGRLALPPAVARRLIIPIELPRVPFIEGDVSLRPELSMEAVEAVTDATVTAELANGRSYVLRQAWTKSALELNPHDGQVRIRF
jgi:hypothetical protein